MSLAVDRGDDYAGEDLQRYRALSPAAVISLVLGLTSIVAWFAPVFAVVPALGVATGLYAVSRIRRAPDEFTGIRLAKAGIWISVFLAVTGWARLSYIYATEVPEGYERVSYEALQPDARYPGQQIPASAQQLDGKKIFIKGFVYPSEFVQDAQGIKKFVLCRDNGQCCFGGQPKLTDMILVTLNEPLRLEYSPGMRRLAGTFKVETVEGNKLGGILYQLTADHLQ